MRHEVVENGYFITRQETLFAVASAFEQTTKWSSFRSSISCLCRRSSNKVCRGFCFMSSRRVLLVTGHTHAFYALSSGDSYPSMLLTACNRSNPVEPSSYESWSYWPAVIPLWNKNYTMEPSWNISNPLEQQYDQSNHL